MSSQNLARVLEDLGRPKVLVLGDLLLDRYTWGDAQRISQEAPVIVLRADRQESRPGGAANVCLDLIALKARVEALGITGNDPADGLLRQALESEGVAVNGLLRDPTRPTTQKQNLIGLAQARHPPYIARGTEGLA